jgi:fructose-bisphosphate aldolase class II
VDEIYEYGSGVLKNEPTDPREAQRYLEKTGVAFLVCNLGTEHRATAAEVFYHSDRAREIRDLVGPRLVLHGTSSLKEEDLCRLAEDGIAKVNIWTRVEKSGGQALAQDTLSHLSEILGQEEMSHFRNKGVITEDYYSSSQGRKPSLAYLTVAHRRNEVWMPTVVKVMKSYFRALGYERLAD